jgi:glycosyltransferase involved in cell wall biosynthesis
VIRFLLIARMLWEKGVGEYVEAARIIKEKYDNVEFQLLGFLDVENRSAISREQMTQWVESGYVNYLGVTDDVQSFIAKADCIVLPSFYREGTPRTLLESASMAKPIITTDNVGCRDVVDDGVNGYICKPKDAKDLAEKIEMFLNLDDEIIHTMGQKSREKMIKEYDEKIVIKKYFEIIEKLIELD